MKAVILAGGLGTRLSEETHAKPKPMVTIGGMPILWHIMKIYSSHGITDFIVCCGYMGYVIKEFFANYNMHSSDVSFNFSTGEMHFHNRRAEDWTVTLVDTGPDTMTGGRLRRVGAFLDDETFCFTYGDGVSDVNISDAIKFHKSHTKLVTVTGVQPPGRFGALDLDDERVKGFIEKPTGDGGWINGGFFVCERPALDYIEGDDTSWEETPLKNLADDGELMMYRHSGFWQPMDTLRDRNHLESLWAKNKAPWKKW